MYGATFLSSAAFLALFSGSAAFSDSYTYYTGDGSIAAGWPTIASWGTWAELWEANSAIMGETCGWNGWGADDSTTEIADIKTAIESVASASGVDERFILAIVMQESEGCVRVPTTNNGVVNPGLMQSHDGTGTCVDTNPCPQSEITQMIEDGTEGTSSGNGLEQYIAEVQAYLDLDIAPRVYYSAARLYNSGSIDYSNLDDGLGSTDCYASDVANRLTGWVLASNTCTA
ncbi:hypothetical protein UA08_09182 [Talaromyces atroroseus]|uniref:Transglycosylase SLT domain-containing protein n=1 Tax=Talaromyces atroroseus TaxID=1441469 RepID=A0A1Q5Q6L8_TALAT|nr:hypothetical protein UA08_09182 [Talaromyces atroroseus]OKL55489.1 hypothetical protein UA08_09182 [Talaromyces atroroseus]